jgi:hypothetical protein
MRIKVIMGLTYRTMKLIDLVLPLVRYLVALLVYGLQLKTSLRGVKVVLLLQVVVAVVE